MPPTPQLPAQVLPVPLPVILTPATDTSRVFCEMKFAEILVAANPVPAQNVIDFSVARALETRRIYGYIFGAVPVAPALVEAVVTFWLDGSPVGTLPLEYSLQPSTPQSRVTALRSGGASEDVLIGWLAGGLTGEVSPVGLNPSNWRGEIDRVTVSVKKVIGVTGYRIIVAVASHK